MDALKRNIKIDYIYCFIRNFDISSAIWVLYMVYKGLPLWQIGIIEGIFHTTSFIFEVPSGAWADLFGRKKVMVAGRGACAVSALILLFSNHFLGFAIGFIISAIGYNLNSGSEEALVYDSMKQAGIEEEYLKVNSKLNLIIEISQGLGTFIGGILAEQSFVYCYVSVIGISLISLLPCLMFREPSIQKKKRERVSLGEHFKVCFRILKDNPKILKVLLYFPLVFTFNTVVFFYGQQYYLTEGCNKVEISLIMLFSGGISCIGALTCEMVLSRLKKKTKYVASIMMGICIVLVSSNQLWISILAFAGMSYANALLYPIQSTSLNRLIPSEQRATMISVDSMVFSLIMIVIFPICGVIADIVNLHVMFLGLGVLQITLSLCIYFYSCDILGLGIQWCKSKLVKGE